MMVSNLIRSISRLIPFLSILTQFNRSIILDDRKSKGQYWFLLLCLLSNLLYNTLHLSKVNNELQRGIYINSCEQHVMNNKIEIKQTSLFSIGIENICLVYVDVGLPSIYSRDRIKTVVVFHAVAHMILLMDVLHE